MSSRQKFSSMHGSANRHHSSSRGSPHGANRESDGAHARSIGSEQGSSLAALAEVMAGHYRYPMGQWGALLLLGLARHIEWHAAAGHVAISEWSRLQQEWLATMIQMEYGLRHLGLSRSRLERMFDVVRLWGMWGVTTQLATAQGLVSSCTPQSLGLPADSGRRAGFDLGRRTTTGAVVIDFPDRRRAAGAAEQ